MGVASLSGSGLSCLEEGSEKIRRAAGEEDRNRPKVQELFVGIGDRETLRVGVAMSPCAVGLLRRS